MVWMNIFHVDTILIIRGFIEFFSLYGVRIPYLNVAPRCGQLVELPVLISSMQQFLFQICNFFLEETLLLLLSYLPCYKIV